jgi:hypothetical protein
VVEGLLVEQLTSTAARARITIAGTAGFITDNS